MTRLDIAIRELADAIRDELAKAPARDEILTIADYAARWSISPSTVRAAIRERRLVVTRLGRAIRINASERIAPKVNDRTEQARMTLLRGGKTP